MCGLVGMAGDIQKPDRDMFQQLLVVDAVRGHHSTGVASVTDQRRLEVFKKALSPIDFLQHKQYDKVVGLDSQVLIGHNRYATVGQVNNRTAHPFEFDGIVGAHNGTLTGWRSDLKDANLFDVDSECLIHNIATEGWDKTIGRMYGAAALSVYHEDTHSLCLYRNKDRPLTFTYNEAGTVLYWASEAWMLRAIAARTGVKLQKDIATLKAGALVSWRLPTKKGAGVGDPHVRKLQGAPEKKPQGYQAPYQRPANHPSPAIRTEAGATSKQNGGSVSSISHDPNWVNFKVGEKVDFVPCSLERSESTNVPYLLGITSDDPWCEIRIYANPPLIDECLDSGCEYTGTISAKISGGQDHDDYILIQAQGLIKGADYSPDVELTHVPGPGGHLVNRKEFEVLAKHGCGECSCDVEFEDDVSWFAGSPICADCTPTK